MKQHAFLIMVHKQPALLGRSLKILAAPNHHFFIHVDSKVGGGISLYKDATSNIDNVHFVNDRESVHHCGISHLYALIKMFKEALKSGTDYDFYHIISGQDYPLRSNKQFDDFFENTEHSFMYIDHHHSRLLKFKYQYWSRGWFPNNTSARWAKMFCKLHLSLIPFIFFRRKAIPNYAGGWDWFSWNRRVMKYVIEFLDENPKLIQRFDHTVCPTEHIFHTILENKSYEFGIEKTNPLRYVSWVPKRELDNKYLPYDLTELDYDRVIDSKAFFCRKVDEKISAQLLNMIDEQRGAEYNLNDHTNFI